MKPVTYEIDTEVPGIYIEKLIEFIHKKYLLPQKDRFRGIAKGRSDFGSVLSYSIVDSEGKTTIQVEVKGSKPIKVKIAPISEKITETAIEEAKQDIVIATQIFEENARKSTLYFAWSEGKKLIPEAIKKRQKSLQRLFLETQVLLFILFTGFAVVLFIAFAPYPEIFVIVPIVLVAVQFIFVFFSTSIIAKTADWKITKDNPTIHLLEYRLPLMENGEFSKAYPPEIMLKIKEEVYESILAKRGEIDCESARKVFDKHGVSCRSENLFSRKVNVYELVKKIADKFGYPVPKIVVSNTMLPNAAASGPSPSRALVLVTTGLLVQLEENEILSVLGHEFGHLRGRDPLILYGLTSAEFLFRFYVILNFFPIFFQSFVLFFVYIFVVFTIIFFIAKFFEARSDLISAIVIGQPGVLAGALEKIGFQRLLFERTPSFRLQEWVGFDPHPPIYFRVHRLQSLDSPQKIKYPLLRSIKDVFAGFAASI